MNKVFNLAFNVGMTVLAAGVMVVAGKETANNIKDLVKNFK